MDTKICPELRVAAYRVHRALFSRYQKLNQRLADSEKWNAEKILYMDNNFRSTKVTWPELEKQLSRTIVEMTEWEVDQLSLPLTQPMAICWAATEAHGDLLTKLLGVLKKCLIASGQRETTKDHAESESRRSASESYRKADLLDDVVEVRRLRLQLLKRMPMPRRQRRVEAVVMSRHVAPVPPPTSSFFRRPAKIA